MNVICCLLVYVMGQAFVLLSIVLNHEVKAKSINVGNNDHKILASLSEACLTSRFSNSRHILVGSGLDHGDE